VVPPSFQLTFSRLKSKDIADKKYEYHIKLVELLATCASKNPETRTICQVESETSLVTHQRLLGGDECLVSILNAENDDLLQAAYLKYFDEVSNSFFAKFSRHL
jgi:hypothetical protein